MDLGPKFQPESQYLETFLEKRDEDIENRVPFGIKFLDDCLGGIYPGSLALIGAGTGVGKTALAVSIALSGTSAGKRVHMFALEADEGEVTKRLYFTELGKLAKEPKLDYSAWYRKEWKFLDTLWSEQIKADLNTRMNNLNTLYRTRGDFTLDTMAKMLHSIANDTDMIILDHVHMIDGDDKSELGTQKRTIQALRDVSITQGIPVVAISHLRKKQQGDNYPMPSIDDFHGSSALSKICTQAILINRAWEEESPSPQLSPTYMMVPKDRGGRGSKFVAKTHYDMSRGDYQDDYALGRIKWVNRVPQWVESEGRFLPLWAKPKRREMPF